MSPRPTSPRRPAAPRRPSPAPGAPSQSAAMPQRHQRRTGLQADPDQSVQNRASAAAAQRRAVRSRTRAGGAEVAETAKQAGSTLVAERPARQVLAGDGTAPIPQRRGRSRRVVVPAGHRFRTNSLRKRLTSKRTWAGVLITALVVGLVWVVGFSQALAVDRISVIGAKRQPPASVRTVLAGQLHQPLARVNLEQAAALVVNLPAVESAQVVRAWPNTLEVRIVERVPVALAKDGPRYLLVDHTGVQLATSTTPVAGLPVLSSATMSSRAATQATVAALGQLPPAMLIQVTSATATSPDSVTFTLKSGTTVIWGSSEDADTKVAALQALLGIKAKVYDVSSPRTPVTR